MTELDLGAEGADGIENILRMPLEPVQVALLSAIWEPIHNSESFRGEAWWPTWDFVSRKVYETHPEVTDAIEVLQSLPSVKTGRPDKASYGLVWWGAAVEARPPSLDARVGLTVAGLLAVGVECQTYGCITADELVSVIRQIALEDSKFKPEPNEVVEAKHLLHKYTKPLREQHMQKPFEFSDKLTISVLRQEYTPLEAEAGGSTIKSGAWLRPYIAVKNSAEYLDVISGDSLAFHQHEEFVSPLTLVQTLDYLTYVLRRHPAWPEDIRLVSAPDIESASLLGLPAFTRADYDVRMTALFNVVDQFKIPRDENEKKRDGTLNELQRWFDKWLDEPQRSEAIDALKVIRYARTLRNERQHSGMSTRTEAVRARRSLGLPDVTSDWGRAWDVVRGKVATALDTIRKSVQSGGAY